MLNRVGRALTFAILASSALVHAPSAVAQVSGQVIDLPVVTVGNGIPPRYLTAGYCTSSASFCLGHTLGSITPATSPDGLTVVAFADQPGTLKAGDVYQRTSLNIAGFTSDPGRTWLASVNCDGITYQGSTASSYSFESGQAKWSWGRPDGAQPAFQGRTSVSCAIHRTGVSGWVRPKYQVVGLTYAPPGSRSSANYANAFMNGTSTSHSSSFTTGITQTVSVTTGFNLFGVFNGQTTQSYSAGWSQQRDSSNSLRISQQISNELIVPGPASSSAGVDHDYDTVYVWLNPMIFTMVFPSTVTVGGYGYDTRDTITGMDVLPLTVGQLRGVQPIPLQAWARLNRTWDTALGGLTSVDLLAISQADPFAGNPGYNPNSDPTHRFELPLSGNPPLPANLIMNFTPVPPGGQPTGQVYSTSYSSTSESGRTAKDTYKVSHSLEGSASFLTGWSTKLKTQAELSSSNQWSSTITNQTTQSARFTIFPPLASDNYTGPTAMQVWKDNVYGTFMFFPQN
ncbi:MAG TPA: hypothetical protein VM146_15700 [Steroidobacteraceae bacterium]|nr:hypothetical protein [Steroidobacteraceae bacterium]